jgi:hypothetical protein
MGIAFILLTASWLHTVCAQSEPLAEDPLTYSSGDLKGQNGGSGWKEGWESRERTFSAIGEGVKVDRDQLAAKDDKSVNAIRRFALSRSSMRTFDTIGLERLPFVLAELFVANLEGAGDVTFRHLIVSTEWPVPPAK